MNGLGGLNKSPQRRRDRPGAAAAADVVDDGRPRRADASASSRMVGKARRNLPTMDLVVFPEYALHGLSMDTNPEIMCTLDGPEVAAFRQACGDNRIWGCFSHHGAATPAAIPYNTGIIIDDRGELRLYYRKLHPWVPVEPWEPGDLGIPVCDGPNGSQARADHLPRRHVPGDGARVRLQGRRDHDPHRRLHRADPPRLAHHQPGQRLLQPDGAPRPSACAARDGTFDSMGEGMIVNFDGTVDRARHERPRRRDHHRRGAARPGARGARALGRREQHLPARPSRLRRGRRAARGTAPTPTCRTWSRAATACRGRTRWR